MTLIKNMTIRFLWKRKSLSLLGVSLEKDAQLVQADLLVLSKNAYV